MARKQVKGAGTVVNNVPAGINSQWEWALRAAALQQDSWRVCVSLLVCDSAEDELCVQALGRVVGLRRRFTLLSWESLLQEVNDLGNPKTRKTKELPPFYEVTEQVKLMMDAAEDPSVHLRAKLVKFQLLNIKSREMERTSVSLTEKIRAGSPPVQDKAPKGSAKGEKGKKAPEVSPPAKETKLRRRGDEEKLHSYIDDEPADGPQQYVLMVGFHQAQLVSELDSIGVQVSNVIRLRSDRTQESETLSTPAQTDSGLSGLQQELDLFWQELDGVLDGGGFRSTLSDVARLDCTVNQNVNVDLNTEEMQALGAAVFDGVASLLYESLIWRKQHQIYLNTLNLISVPISECVDVDMRLYLDLLDRIPSQMISVPLILHCMIEQVVGSEQNVVVSDPDQDLISYMLSSITQLPLSEQDRRDLGFKEDKGEQRHPILLHHHDERAKRLHGLSVDGVDVMKVEGSMMEQSMTWKTLLSNHIEMNEIDRARKHELLQSCCTDSLSHSEVNRWLQLCVFEGVPLTSVDEGTGLTLAPSHTPLPWDDPAGFIHTVYSSSRTAGCEDQEQQKEEQSRVTAADLQKILKRDLKEWSCTEYHSPNVFPQVLQAASDSYRCLDSFSSAQSGVVFLTCHEPMSLDRSSRGSWEATIHTDVGFRSYLEHVSPSVSDLIRSEQEKQQTESELERSDTASELSRITEPSVSPDQDSTDLFIRHNSLKALKLDRQMQDESFKQRHSKQNKLEENNSANPGERNREEQNNPPKSTGGRNEDGDNTHTHTGHQRVLTGYCMDGHLVQVKGEIQYLYPSDGGKISVERIQYVQGSTQLKVCVKKGGHSFYTHIIRPQRQSRATLTPTGVAEDFRCFFAELSNGIRISYSHSKHKHQVEGVSPMELYVSLPTGLQICFRFIHTADGWIGFINQLLPPGGSALLHTHTELSRSIYQGTVIKHLRDSSTEVLFADGTVSVSTGSGPSSALSEDEGVEPGLRAELQEQVEVRGGSWCTTTPSGSRIRTVRGQRVEGEQEEVQSYLSTDPFTQSVLRCRDDGVLYILHPDGSTTHHSDGTTITSSDQQRETAGHQGRGGAGGRMRRVRVEKSGYVTVLMDCESRNSELLFKDGTTIRSSAHGSYQVSLCNGASLSIGPDGAAVYSPEGCDTGPEGERPGHYTMSHSQDLICKVTEPEGRRYEVTAEGHTSIRGHTRDQETDDTASGSHTHPPRLFVVYPDGSALEFLSDQTVEEILQQESTDQSAAVIREPLTHTHDVFVITILKPFSGDLNSYWLSPTHLDDITPDNLTSRKWDSFPTSEMKGSGPVLGAALGRGLELKDRTKPGADWIGTGPALQNPDTLLIRRITSNTHTPYELLQDKLLEYLNQLLQREKLRDEMKLKDPRTPEERRTHTDLLQRIMFQTECAAADGSGLTPQSALSLYSETLTPGPPPSDQSRDQDTPRAHQKKQGSQWRNRIHQHRVDLHEERKHRHALRNHIITPYLHPNSQQ